MLIPKNVKLALRLASDIVQKLPSRGDTLLQICVKIIAIVDSTSNIMAPAKQNALDRLLELRGLVETKNEQFVRLFFDTNLYEQFTVRRFSLTDYQDLIEASHPSLGSIIFVEFTYSNNGPEESFYHSKALDFSKILQGLWDAYHGRLHVTISAGQYGVGTRSEFASFSEIPNPLYGGMQERMDRLMERHQRFAKDKIPRSYMFYGKAGSGKSSFALKFADKLGGHTIKMDAQSLTHAHVKDITFLLTNLKPDFLVIDDVDKADTVKGLPTLLDILQRFKTDNVRTSLVMTSNSTENFDEGFIRPGRVDTWEEFKLPETEERHELLTKYIADFGLSRTEGIDELVKITEGLSQDYIREVALILRYDSLEDVVKTVTLYQTLLKVRAEKAKEAAAKAAVPANGLTPPAAEGHANGVTLKASA
jgi:hypothetical protein